MLFTMDKRRSKIDRNSVFDCHLSPIGRQMTIKNSASNNFLSTFVDSIDVLECHLLGVGLSNGKIMSIYGQYQRDL